MPNEDEPDVDAKSTHGIFAPGSLESAASYVARSTAASGARNGSREEFTATFSALLEWGEIEGIIRQKQEIAFFRRVPDAAGNEHEVWFDEPTNRWFKATYPNRFGLAWGRPGSANPAEYLSRLLLQNEYFEDDIKLVALVNCRGKLRVLISQPHIQGEAATVSQIEEWFRNLEFSRLESGDRFAWYNRDDNLLVADAHQGNIIQNRDGSLTPIDLNIVRPTGELRRWALSFK
jgi:hypothetical protein